MAARHNLTQSQGGAAALTRYRERAASVCPDAVSLDGAAGLARVSTEAIKHAWKRGDLPAVSPATSQILTFSAEAVKTWALGKRLIF